MNSEDKKTTASRDEDFLKRSAALFEDSVDGLDAHTRSRLNKGRQQALAASDSSMIRWNLWMPAGAAAAVAMIAMVMWNGAEQPEAFSGEDFATPAMASDLEILMDEDDLEMLEELEFYSWIDLDDDLGSADPDEHVG